MTLDIGNLLTGGGVTGTLLVVAYLIREFFKGRQERQRAIQEQRQQTVQGQSTAVNDQATANATLLGTLAWQRGRIQDLEAENDELRGDLDREREDRHNERAAYETEINELQQKIRALVQHGLEMNQQLTALRARISDHQDKEHR